MLNETEKQETPLLDVAKARERWSRALALEPEDGGAAIRAKLERTAAAEKTP